MARTRKQLEVPGTEPVRFEDVEDAALEYREVRDRRQALTEQEVEKQAVLVQRMKDHGIPEYKFRDDDNRPVTVSLESTTKAKVRLAKAPVAEADAGGEEAVLDS